MTYTEDDLRNALRVAAEQQVAPTAAGGAASVGRHVRVGVAAAATAAVVIGVFGLGRIATDQATPIGDHPQPTATFVPRDGDQGSGRPARLTLDEAATKVSVFPLRVYGGSEPPQVSEANVIATHPGGYVLGLRDVRVPGNGRPDSRWRSFWLVAGEFRTDDPRVDEFQAKNGPLKRDRRPGWTQLVTLIDSTQGTTWFTTQQTFLDHRPPKPPHFTTEDVERRFNSRRFRAYTGPTPPPLTADALQARYPGSYVIGMRDVASLNGDGEVQAWTPVWILGASNYVDDVNAGCLGCGLPRPDGFREPPLPPRPGWVKQLTMVNAVTGAFVLGSN